jgi:phosphoserine aminotransferase
MNCIGIRVSLYNAITGEQTEQLIEYIREFVKQEKGRTGSGTA